MAALYWKVLTSGASVILALEERCYRLGQGSSSGNRQFVVAAPDGYPLRLHRDLAIRICNAEEL